MIDNAAKGTLLAFRIGVSVLLAVAINVLLFYLIQHLVSSTPTVLSELEDIYAVDFIRVKPEPEQPERRPKEKKSPPPKKLEQPPEPTLFKPHSINKPKPPKLDVPEFALKLPRGLTDGPYLGDFQADSSEPDLSSLDAGKPILQIPPVYPPRARRAGIEGRVLVEFTISENGTVENPKIIEAKPPKIFNRAVLRAIRRWKFNPRVSNGHLREQRARKEIVFKLKER